MNKTKYLADATAIITVSNPIFALIETVFAGMSDEVSIKSRFYATALNYLGMGWLYANGRALSRKIFHVHDNSNEFVQGLHDILYGSAFAGAMSKILYPLAGEQDVKKAAFGITASMLCSPVIQYLTGYSIDAFEDMTGIKACERSTYPEFVRRQSPTTKKYIAAVLSAASVGAMAIIYNLQ